MPMHNRGEDHDRRDALEREVLRLRRELENLKKSSFDTIRDLEISHRREVEALSQEHDSKVRELTTKHRLTLTLQQQEAQDTRKKAVDAATQTVRQDWQKELQREVRKRLAAAAEEWARAEKERTTKIKVDLVHDKTEALAERDAFWKAEIARLVPVPGSDAPERRSRRRRDGGKRRSAPEIDPSGPEEQSRSGLLATLVLLFLGSAAAYLFAPQWQPVLSVMTAPMIEQAAPSVKESVYRALPWLKPAKAPDRGTAVPVAFVKAGSANVRRGPSTGTQVVGTMRRGDRVVVVERKDGWARIETPDGAPQSWIHGSLLGEDGPAQDAR